MYNGVMANEENQLNKVGFWVEKIMYAYSGDLPMSKLAANGVQVSLEQNCIKAIKFWRYIKRETGTEDRIDLENIN